MAEATLTEMKRRKADEESVDIVNRGEQRGTEADSIPSWLLIGLAVTARRQDVSAALLARMSSSEAVSPSSSRRWLALGADIMEGIGCQANTGRLTAKFLPQRLATELQDSNFLRESRSRSTAGNFPQRWPSADGSPLGGGEIVPGAFSWSDAA